MVRLLRIVWATTLLLRLSEAHKITACDEVDTIDGTSLVQITSQQALLATVRSTMNTLKASQAADLTMGCVLGAFLFGTMGAFFFARRKAYDVAVAGSCISIVLLVAVFIFSSLGTDIWFSWHPVLMTLSFPCLMTLGKWTYIADDSWGIQTKQSRRGLHGLIMALATVSALVGYLCIFMAHIPKGSYFGYDFKKHQWNPDRGRIAHSIFGYVVLLAVLFQCLCGLSKYMELNKGVRTMTFHGTLGKVIMFGGAANIVLAMTFWGWSILQKIVILGLLVLTTAAASVLSSPQGFLPLTDVDPPGRSQELNIADPTH